MKTKTIECPRCSGRGRIPDPASIAAELRELRAKAGLSQRRLGELIGKSAPYLHDIEHGRRTPTNKTAEDWRRACR